MARAMENFGFFLSRLFATTRPVCRGWPYVLGKYFVVVPAARLAVTTLGSVGLAQELAKPAP